MPDEVRTLYVPAMSCVGSVMPSIVRILAAISGATPLLQENVQEHQGEPGEEE